MKTIFKIVSGISLLSFPIAITYIVEPNIYHKSLVVFAPHLVGILFFMALANGMLDAYIFRIVETEDVKRQLIRIGLGGILFSVVFISVLIYRL